MIRRFIWRGSLRFPLSAQFYKHCLQLYTERDPLYLRSGWKLIANNKLHTLVRNLPCDVALLCFFFFFVYCSLPSMRCVDFWVLFSHRIPQPRSKCSITDFITHCCPCPQHRWRRRAAHYSQCPPDRWLLAPHCHRMMLAVPRRAFRRRRLCD